MTTPSLRDLTPDEQFAEVTRGAVKEHPKAAKVRFAKEMVARFHSAAEAERAAAEFERIHARREVPERIEEKAYPLSGAASVGVLKLMSDLGLASSNSEARRLVSQGGVSINGERASDPKASVSAGDYLLQVGKRRFIKVKVGAAGPSGETP